MAKVKVKVKQNNAKKAAPQKKADKTLTTQISYPKMTDKRLTQIYSQMEDLKLDAVVVTHRPNIRYLTNFSGSFAAFFILKDSLHFVTDDRYEEQIKTELYPLPNLQTYISRDPWQTAVDKKIIKGVKFLGFEADRMPYSEAVNNRNIIRPVKFKPEDMLVERYTQPKAPEELAFIQKAAEISEKVFTKILKMIKPGVTERDIAIEISYIGRKLGSEGDPFDIIVVSGPRGSLIHGKPSDRQIKKNDIIILDFGCIVSGFRSDITRTVSVGKPSKEQKDIYKLLKEAQKAAIDFVRPGMNGKNLDKAARSLIEKAGYGKFFQHSLGHGIGIETHEMPIITFRKSDQIVPEDVVLAIEPGIYLPGKYGMRVEDMIVVTRNGGKNITNSPDELVVI